MERLKLHPNIAIAMACDHWQARSDKGMVLIQIEAPNPSEHPAMLAICRNAGP